MVEGAAPPLPLPIAYRDNDIALYRVGGTTPAASGRALLIAAHVVWLGMLIGALALFLAAHDKLEQRASIAVQEVEQYLADPAQYAETSVGQRLEQWRLAERLIARFWPESAGRTLPARIQSLIQALTIVVVAASKWPEGAQS